MLAGISGLVLWLFAGDVAGSLAAFLLAVAVVVAGFMLTRLLDTGSFRERCQLGRVNLAWLVIVPAGLAPFLVGFSVLAGFLPPSFDIDLANAVHRDAVIFFATVVLLGLPATFLYFGVKNARTLRRAVVVPKTAFLAIILSLLIFTSCAGFVLYNGYFVQGSIASGTGHNDGPWVTWHDDPARSAAITWLTAQPNSTTLTYGTSPGALDLTVHDPAMVHVHKVYLRDLLPGTTYFYRVPEAFDTPHDSTLFSFTTAPAVPRNYTFAVFGDMQPTGTGDDVMRTNAMVIDGLISRNVDFALQLGDIASTGTNVNHWHLSMTSFARLAANTPVMAAIGNHDWSGIAGSVNWGHLFSYPYAGTGLGKYYSFDYLDAHFVVLDNFEQMYAMTKAQLAWFERDVLAARARGQSWFFVTFHLSLMTTATSGMQDHLQRELVPLLDRLAVDAVFFAHDHHYEHYNYTYGHNGLVYEPHHDWTHHPVQYICSGSGGASLEVGYGVLEPARMDATSTVRWWNVSASRYQDATYERRAWNASRFVENPGFPENYTQVGHDGKYYYHLPDHELHHDQAPQLGFTYGEQAYHFIEVSIDPVAKTCTITARYPNGALLGGPGGLYPQSFTLTKA